MSSNRVLTASIFAFSIAGITTDASASTKQELARTDLVFKSRKDSVDWARHKAAAAKVKGFRIIVSLKEAHLWVIIDEDTLLSAPAAVATGKTLSYQGYVKTFDTPRGPRTVQGKDADPIWQPPDWLYYETGEEMGLKVKFMPSKGSLTMPDGRKLYVNDQNEVGVIDSEGPTKFPSDLHIIFDQTLYVPPLGTENRKVHGTLGKYKLILGQGYLFHGTPDQNSIGLPATHGCIRLRDQDIEWLYENIPVGTKVYIY